MVRTATPARILRSAAVAACLVVGVCEPAHAAPATRLIYSRGAGAEGCADEAALRRAVAQRVGYDPFFPWGKVTLVASVRRVANVYHAHIELLDAQGLVRGTRDLADAHAECSELLSAMALGISIALDTLDPRPPEPEPSPRPSEPPPTPAPSSSEPSGPPPAAARTNGRPPASASPPRSLRPDSFDVGLGALVLVGALPAPVVGASGFGRYRRGPASLALELSAGLPGTKRGRFGSEAEAFTAAGGVVPCVHFAPIAICGLALVSTVQATAPEAKAAWFVALGLRLATEIPLSAHWSGRLHADLVAPLSPVTLRVDGAELWTTARLGGRFGIGAAYRFW